MFAKSEHLNGGTRAGDLLQRLAECLPVSRGDEHTGEPLAASKRDMGEHVAVDIAVLVDLRLGEDREAYVTQCLDPGSNDVGAAGRDIGEDGGLWLQRDVVAPRGKFGGARQQPAAQRVESR